MAEKPRFKEMYHFPEVTSLIKPLNGWNMLVTWFEIIEAHQPKTPETHLGSNKISFISLIVVRKKCVPMESRGGETRGLVWLWACAGWSHKDVEKRGLSRYLCPQEAGQFGDLVIFI